MRIFLSGVSQLQMKSETGDTWFKGINMKKGFLTECNEDTTEAALGLG